MTCCDALCRFLVEKLNKKHKNAQVKPFMVKNHLWVFVNTSIENPAFDSQVGCGCDELRQQGPSACTVTVQGHFC